MDKEGKQGDKDGERRWGGWAHNHVAFLFLVLNQTGLSAYLGCNVIMGQSCCREEGDLLASSNRIQGIYGGNACLNHLLWVCPLCWIDGGSIDIQERLC